MELWGGKIHISFLIVRKHDDSSNFIVFTLIIFVWNVKFVYENVTNTKIRNQEETNIYAPYLIKYSRFDI